MNPKVLEFLKKERVCVLTVLLPDGSPHSATMKFYYDEESKILMFATRKSSEKCTGLINASQKSSVAIGLSEEDMVTLQLRGDTAIVVGGVDLQRWEQNYYAKFPENEKYKGPETAYLMFTPKWWKYMNHKVHPMEVIKSEESTPTS